MSLGIKKKKKKSCDPSVSPVNFYHIGEAQPKAILPGWLHIWGLFPATPPPPPPLRWPSERAPISTLGPSRTGGRPTGGVAAGLGAGVPPASAEGLAPSPRCSPS